jgi:hypothetical protein
VSSIVIIDREKQEDSEISLRFSSDLESQLLDNSARASMYVLKRDLRQVKLYIEEIQLTQGSMNNSPRVIKVKTMDRTSLVFNAFLHVDPKSTQGLVYN